MAHGRAKTKLETRTELGVWVLEQEMRPSGSGGHGGGGRPAFRLLDEEPRSFPSPPNRCYPETKEATTKEEAPLAVLQR
jgi:hypothetical protein